MFKAAVCPALNPLNPLNPPNPPQCPPSKPCVQQQPGPQPLQFNKFQRLARPTVFKGLQAYRLPALKFSKPSTPPQPQPGHASPTGVQGCRLPGLKPLKPLKPSKLPQGPPSKPCVQQQPGPQPLQFKKFQPQPGRATSNCFLRVFKAAVCQALNPLNPLNPPNSRGAPQASLASSSSQGHSPFNSTNSSGWHAQLFLKVFKPIVCPPLNFLNPLHRPSRSQDRRPSRNASPTVFKGVHAAVCPALNPLNPPNPPHGPPSKPRPAAARATAPAIQQIPAAARTGHVQLFLRALNPLNPLNP